MMYIWALSVLSIIKGQLAPNLPLDQFDVDPDAFEESLFINDVVNRRIANAYDMNLGVTATPLVGVSLHSRSPRTGVRSPSQEPDTSSRFRRLVGESPYGRPGRRRLTSNRRRLRDEEYLHWLKTLTVNATEANRRLIEDLRTIAAQLDNGVLITPLGEIPVPLGPELAQNYRVYAEAVENQQLPVSKQSWRELRSAYHLATHPESPANSLKLATPDIRTPQPPNAITASNTLSQTTISTKFPLSNSSQPISAPIPLNQSTPVSPTVTGTNQLPLTNLPSSDEPIEYVASTIDKNSDAAQSTTIPGSSETEPLSKNKGFLSLDAKPAGSVNLLATTTSDTLPWLPLDGIVGSLPGVLVDRMGRTGELLGQIVGYWRSQSVEIDKLTGGVLKPILANLDDQKSNEDYTGSRGLVENKNVPDENVSMEREVVTGAGIPSRALSSIKLAGIDNTRHFQEFPEVPHPYFPPLDPDRKIALEKEQVNDEGNDIGVEGQDKPMSGAENINDDYFVVGSKHKSDNEEDAAYRAFIRPRKNHPWVSKVPVDLVINNDDISGQTDKRQKKPIKGVVKQLRMPRWGDGSLYGEGFGEWPMEDMYDEDGYLVDPWGIQETVAGYSYKRFRRRWDGSLIADEWDDEAVDTAWDYSHLDTSRLAVSSSEEPDDIPLDDEIFYPSDRGLQNMTESTTEAMEETPEHHVNEAKTEFGILDRKFLSDNFAPRDFLQSNSIVSRLWGDFLEGTRRVVEVSAPPEIAAKSQNDQIYARMAETISKQKQSLDDYLHQMATIYGQKDHVTEKHEVEPREREPDTESLRNEVRKIVESELQKFALRSDANRTTESREATTTEFDETEMQESHEDEAVIKRPPGNMVRDLIDGFINGLVRGDTIESPIRQLAEAAAGLIDEDDLPRPKIALNGILPEMLDMLNKGTGGKTILDENREWVVFEGKEPEEIVSMTTVTTIAPSSAERQLPISSTEMSKVLTDLEWVDVATEWGDLRRQLIDKIASSVEDVTKSMNESPLTDIVQSLIESLVSPDPSSSESGDLKNPETGAKESFRDRMTQNTAKVLRQMSRNVIMSGPKFKAAATNIDIAQPDPDGEKKVHGYEEPSPRPESQWWW